MGFKVKELELSLLSQSSVYPLISKFILHNSPIHTKENTFVWKKMINNILKSFKEYESFIYPPFKEGFHSLGLDNFSIPNINTINQKLSNIGWEAVYVNGFVPAGIYALMLANQFFPISASLRPLKYFEYSAAPDFAHDILGHLPMLFVKDFRELLKKWAMKASQCKITFLDQETYRLTASLIREKEEKTSDISRIGVLTKRLNSIYDQLNTNPSDLSVLAKYYGWSFEFGVIKINGIPNIFGAAIVSSSKETQNVCEGKATFLEFNEDTLKTGVNYTSLQEKFFYVKDFTTYYHYLNNILIDSNEENI